MRTIKFRAWLPVLKKMSHPFGLLDIPLDLNRHLDYIPIMQFTGLHDKNGKEIWEGDIVKASDDFYDWYEYEGCRIFTVDLSRIRFWCKEELFGYEGELLLNASEFEVIGNIYENPELLEVKQS